VFGDALSVMRNWYPDMFLCGRKFSRTNADELIFGEVITPSYDSTIYYDKGYGCLRKSIW
jgi:hypothetical protein